MVCRFLEASQDISVYCLASISCKVDRLQPAEDKFATSVISFSVKKLKHVMCRVFFSIKHKIANNLK